MQQLWPHQQRGIDQALAAEAAGRRAICVTSPTGGGKRTMLVELCKRTLQEGGRPVVWTNRRILTSQTYGEFVRQGIEYGVLAAGYRKPRGEPVLVCSAQTARSRCDGHTMPAATRVFIDECRYGDFLEIEKHYLARGATVIGFDATPVGLKGRYEQLVVAGTNSELRACGALVECWCYSPEQPDLKGVKRTKVGEYFKKDLLKRFNAYRTDVFGNVFSWWKKLNPWADPTLLFAPGVAESRWFVGQLEGKGVPAAHIDGSTPEGERERILRGHKEGEIKVISSCGVLKDGFDAPWVRHGILVQVCGRLSSFLQIAGRLLRAAEGKGKAILQDHAGAVWRHGTPNQNRQWSLDDDDKSLAKKAREPGPDGKAKDEMVRCPECGMERRFGPECPHCHHRHKLSVRMVRMSDGTLKRVTGRLEKRKRASSASPDDKAWMGCLYAAAFRKLSLRVAAGLFRKKTGHALPPGVRNQPPNGSPDWLCPAGDVYPWLLRRRGRAG